MTEEPSPDRAAAHEAATTCSEIRFNTFQTLDSRTAPAVSAAAPEPRYGEISRAPNLGLRFSQKTAGPESFNSGCVNPQGCVSSQGFGCGGPARREPTYMAKLFDEMNAPLVDGLEHNPPPYTMGVKNGSINSVTGWQTDPGGRPLWQLLAAPTLTVPCARPPAP